MKPRTTQAPNLGAGDFFESQAIDGRNTGIVKRYGWNVAIDLFPRNPRPITLHLSKGKALDGALDAMFQRCVARYT